MSTTPDDRTKTLRSGFGPPVQVRWFGVRTDTVPYRTSLQFGWFGLVVCAYARTYVYMRLATTHYVPTSTSSSVSQFHFIL